MNTRIAMMMRKAPYGSVYPAEAFRAMMGIAVFELDVCVIFMDAGVCVLAKGQDPSALDMKPLGEGFATLPEVGIAEVYVQDESLVEYGLSPSDLVLQAKVVSAGHIAEILEHCSSVLSF